MKENIIKVDRDGRTSDDSNFWQYDLYCDNCGKYILTHVSVMTPEVNSKDYCISCMMTKEKNK